MPRHPSIVAYRDFLNLTQIVSAVTRSQSKKTPLGCDSIMDV